MRPENTYGNIAQPPAHEPIKLAPEIARKRLHDKIAAQQKAAEEIARLQAAAQRADDLHEQALQKVREAASRVDLARQAHMEKMASALSAGTEPEGKSPAVTDARAKLREAEDYRDAAAGAFHKIETELNAATARSENLKGIAFELAEVIGDDVDALYEAASAKLLELIKMRSALAYCLRSGLCRNARGVNQLLNTLVLYNQDGNQASPSPEWQEATNVAAWIAGVERMKTDPKARFPVLK